MLMSPQTWRALIKPHLARITAVGKAKGLWVAYHCCGALRPIIPDLIEIGIDVLNPIQCNCPGMDAAGTEGGIWQADGLYGRRGYPGPASHRDRG